MLGKTTAVAVVALLALAVLTGCFDVEQRLKVNADGSGEIESTFLMDAGLIDAAAAESGEDAGEIFGDIESSARAEGFEVEPIEREGQRGIRATKAVGDVTTLDVGEISEGATGEVRIEKGLLKNAYSVDITLPFDSAAAGELGEDPAALESFMDARFVLELPSRITDTNGDIGDDPNTATWDMNLTGDTVIQAAAVGWNWPVLAAIGGVVALILVVAVVLIIRASSASKRQPVSATAVPPAPTASTTRVPPTGLPSEEADPSHSFGTPSEPQGEPAGEDAAPGAAPSSQPETASAADLEPVTPEPDAEPSPMPEPVAPTPTEPPAPPTELPSEEPGDEALPEDEK